MKIVVRVNLIFENLVKLKHQSIESLASALQIDNKSVNNYLGGTNVSNDVINKLFFYLETMSYDLFDILNLEDSSFYYHMSTNGLHGAISAKYNAGNEYSDFGYGFYLSESFKVAATYIKRSDNPHIYCFSRHKIHVLKPYLFKETDKGCEDWVLYIGLNRRKIDDHVNQTILNERFNKLFRNEKCIVGKIADSLNFDVMDEFFKNNYDIFQVKAQLTKANLGLQYVIKDEIASNSLTYDKEYVFDKGMVNLITMWRKSRNERLKEDNAKQIKTSDTKENYKFNKIIERIIDEK